MRLLARVLLLMMFTLPAWALDFISVKTATAVLYDGPSTQAKPLFVTNRGYPFEVISRQENWVKVRDESGLMAWVQTDNVGDAHTVVMRVSGDAHTDASASAPVCAHVAAGVMLPWSGNVNGRWAKVTLPNQSTAYVSLDQLWGA